MSVYMGLKKKRCSDPCLIRTEPMSLPVHEPSHGPNGLVKEKIARLWCLFPCKLPPSFVNQLFILVNLWS